jgi:hypothetical protein
MLTTGVVLHHDNTRPHTAAATVETIQKLKLELLPHPSFSPNLAPCDYHILEPLKNALRGRQFANDEEVKDAMYKWLRARPKTFIASPIGKFVDRSNKCVQKLWDYVERWH